MFIYPVPRYQGRDPVISSKYRSSDRPGHIGADIMYARLPSDGGPAGQNAPPHLARRFFMPFGIPALSAGPGTVSISEDIKTGGYVKIEHTSGLSSQYMHLKDRKVNVGDTVKAGEPIGYVHYNPNEPHFPLVHLHFQLRQHGTLKDPAPFLSQVPIINNPEMPLLLTLALIGGAGFFTYKVLS